MKVQLWTSRDNKRRKRKKADKNIVNKFRPNNSCLVMSSK